MSLKSVCSFFLFLMISNIGLAQQPEIEPREDVAQPPLKNRVISLAPIQFTDNGIGFSVSYERFIDKNQYVSYCLPLVFTWNLASDNYFYKNVADQMTYFIPGIKIYPTGSGGKVKYAVGPSLEIAAGQYTPADFEYGLKDSETYNKWMVGMLINNSVNFNIKPWLVVSLNLGFGFSYINNIAGNNQPMSFLAEGGMKLGYRF